MKTGKTGESGSAAMDRKKGELREMAFDRAANVQATLGAVERI